MSAWQVCDLPLSYTQKPELWVPSNPPCLCADFQAHGAPNSDLSHEDGHEMGTARFALSLIFHPVNGFCQYIGQSY